MQSYILDTPFEKTVHDSEVEAYRHLVDIVVPENQCDALRDALMMSLHQGGRFLNNAVESLERLAWFMFRVVPGPSIPEDEYRELVLRH